MKEDNIVKIDRTKSVITNHEVKRRLKRIWDDEGEKFVKIFKEVLVAVKAHYEVYNLDILSDGFVSRRYQSMIGAHGIGKTRLDIGLISQNAWKIKYSDNKNNTPLVFDHLIGYKSISKEVVQNIIHFKFNDEYLCNNWLENHICLWMGVKVTKEEHKADNIKRGDKAGEGITDVKSKLMFKHYRDDISILLDKNFKSRFFN
tara:strand:+ start:74 stop:679 length:606 start_codon:yes stop_codon:yes gene_type:complete